MKTVSFKDIALYFLRSRKGIASVEFVLILPLLVVFLFGTIEIGRALHDYHVVVKGVRDGARYLSRVKVDCSCGVGCAGSIVNIPDNHELRAKHLTRTGLISPSLPGDYLLAAWGDPATSLDVNVFCNAPDTLTGIFSDDDPFVVPTVTMEADVKFNFLGSLPVLPNTINFTVSHKEINVGE